MRIEGEQLQFKERRLLVTMPTQQVESSSARIEKDIKVACITGKWNEGGADADREEEEARY